uniref:Uncharacterized protein n=1 Tax=Oryza barthii TaxID=65489 RepID=A0A0D3FKH3_9ORYZ
MLLRSCRRLRKGSYLSPTRRMDTPSSTHLDDSVSVNAITTSKKDISELGPPDQFYFLSSIRQTFGHVAAVVWQILHIDDWSKRKEMEKMKNRLHTVVDTIKTEAKEVQLMRFDAICIHGSDERSDTIDIDKEASSEQATTADGNLQYAGGEPAIDGASGH